MRFPKTTYAVASLLVAFLSTAVAAFSFSPSAYAWDPVNSLGNLSSYRPGIDYLKKQNVWTTDMVDTASCDASSTESPDKIQHFCDKTFLQPEIEAKLESLENQLKSTTVDKKNPSSIETYNALVAKYNVAVESENARIKKECISGDLYCKPVRCDEKLKGSGYDKTSGECVCPAGSELVDGKACVKNRFWINFLLFAVLGLIAFIALIKTFR